MAGTFWESKTGPCTDITKCLLQSSFATASNVPDNDVYGFEEAAPRVCVREEE